MTAPGELYAAIESELADEMGLDIARATPADRRRLSTAVALALRIDADQGRLRVGLDVDLRQHIADQGALTALLASPAAAAPDADAVLAVLSDAELSVLRTAHEAFARGRARVARSEARPPSLLDETEVGVLEGLVRKAGGDVAPFDLPAGLAAAVEERQRAARSLFGIEGDVLWARLCQAELNAEVAIRERFALSAKISELERSIDSLRSGAELKVLREKCALLERQAELHQEWIAAARLKLPAGVPSAADPKITLLNPAVRGGATPRHDRGAVGCIHANPNPSPTGC